MSQNDAPSPQDPAGSDLPPNAAEIIAAARRLAKAVARADKYGGSFGAHVQDRFTALLKEVGPPEEGWDTGPHTSDAETKPWQQCPATGPSGEVCEFSQGHTGKHSFEPEGEAQP